MYTERIRTIGISLLGGNSGVEGEYELGIDSIRAVNEEDVTTPIRKHCFFRLYSVVALNVTFYLRQGTI